MERTRKAVAHERNTWLSIQHDLKLQHSESNANLIFFNEGMPQQKIAAAMLSHGIDIGRCRTHHIPIGHLFR
jgi:hypothetical protein